jgi:arabinofuranosyltransferase
MLKTPRGTPTPASKVVPRLGTAIGLTALVVFAWLHQHHYDFEHDDAYISYRYAANWASGLGPVYNPGERVEGYSNFLFIVVLRACAKAGLDIVDSARFIGSLSHIALILLTFYFMTSVLARRWTVAIASAGAVAVHAALAAWALSGLETLPFSLLFFLALTAFIRERRSDTHHFLSGFLFGALSLLRADGFVPALATALFLLLRRRSWRRLATFLAPFILVIGPYLLWRISYYGHPLPNSYYLKTGGDYFQQFRGLFYTYNFVVPFGGWTLLSLPLALLVLRDPTRNEIRLYIGYMVVVVTIYVIWVGGDHMPMSRFFVPILAPLIILLTEAVVELGRLFDGRITGSGRYALAVGLALIVTSSVAPTLNPRRLPASYVISHRTLVRQWAMAGRWLGHHYDPKTVMATEPAGAVAYFSGLFVIDMLGVNDEHIAHITVPNMGHGGAGHEKRDLNYVLSRQPRLIFRGVRPTAGDPGTITTYDDGSRYRLRTEPLGVGPIADDFGVVRQIPLFIWLDERLH